MPLTRAFTGAGDQIANLFLDLAKSLMALREIRLNRQYRIWRITALWLRNTSEYRFGSWTRGVGCGLTMPRLIHHPELKSELLTSLP